MMLPFYLERLTISGLQKQESVIEFAEGLTFVVGPSNTGKSHVMDCIDYLFGFSESKTNPFRFESDWGYDIFTLVVRTPRGNVILRRKLGDNQISVNSTDPKINTGKYSASTRSAASISSVWLKLIGIEPPVQVLRSKEGNRQRLSWRSIMHLFFVRQDQVARVSSALLSPKSYAQQTSSLSALLYLITGKDASQVITPENRQMKKARMEAIIVYIDQTIQQLGERLSVMEEKHASAPIPDMALATEKMRAEIDSVQHEIDIAVSESKTLMEQIYSGNSRLSELDTIRDRFKFLREQYIADMERLAFVADAEAVETDVPRLHHCPFCNAELVTETAEPLYEATLQEFSHIKSHLSELEAASMDIDNQRTALTDQIQQLEKQREKIDQQISTSLSPKIAYLKEQLQGYASTAKQAQEIATIMNEKTRYEAELFGRRQDLEKNEDNPSYDIKTEYGFELIHKIQDKLSGILRAIQFPGGVSAKLNYDTFDLEIRGKQKSNVMGGGFCGILNSIMLLAIREVLYESGKYPIGILMLDSPLTQLSESQYGEKANVIRDSFIKYLLEHQEYGQVIFIDQKEKMPAWLNEDSKCMFHEFTKSQAHGRYGLLNDVYDEE